MEEIYPIKELYHSEPRKSQIKELSLGYLSGNETKDLSLQLNNTQWISICEKYGWYYINHRNQNRKVFHN